MTDSLNTHGGLTEDSLSDPVRTHDRKGREGKGGGDRKGYPSLTLVNADTREGSHVSDSLPSRPSHRVTGQADSTRWLG